MNESEHWANVGLPSQKEYFEERYQEYLEQGYSLEKAHHLADDDCGYPLEIWRDDI